ncbi:hypothetical protein NMY22_g7661 [Coprinellus aureogranulatus]|nr:hypothetical protein NMY22_g7661 [Coprinellus aureogranulatus]
MSSRQSPTTPPLASTSQVYEYSSHDSSASATDALFLERLDTFLDRSLADIRAFSEREGRPFEETRRRVAEWHAKDLFQSSLSSATEETANARHDYVRTLLMNTSRVLESLAHTAGVQSFLLAVDLREERDGGFLGGSVHGREFWRTLRGGGEHGAKSFRQYCQKNEPAEVTTNNGYFDMETGPSPSTHAMASASCKQLDAKSVKAELYETVRRALKTASGVRNAEMKWTNPERLDVYGVRLVGWPPGVPSLNPSTLRVSQNRQLLEAFKSGSAKFERLPTSAHPPPTAITDNEVDNADNDDFSWAFDADAFPPARTCELRFDARQYAHFSDGLLFGILGHLHFIC